jgi:hypothetical protein
MRKYIITTTALLVLAAFFAVSCADRGTNVPETSKEKLVDRWQIFPQGNHVFAPPNDDPSNSPQLLFQVRNVNSIQEMAIYVPREAWPPPTGEGLPVPLLVLLPPQDGSKYFYFNHGLLELAQEMLVDGEIEPMVIACLGNDRIFGGYFFGNSYPAGFYDDIIGTPEGEGLVTFLTNLVPSIIDSPDKRGIGGVGMGGYGAFRAVLKHPGVFSSVSVTDGPLDFDGSDGNSGLINLFDDALVEQEQVWANKPDEQTQGLPFAFPDNFDTSFAAPVSALFTGGSLAFSPNDTLVTYDITFPNQTSRIVNILDRYKRGDSATLVTGIIKEDAGAWAFHLPFDGSGNVYRGPSGPGGPDDVWGLWLENNLETILGDVGASALNGVNMWFGTSEEATWGYSDMTESWISTLTLNGFSPEVKEYGGYDGKPATQHEYLYDMLREILIFHSDNFAK